MILIVIALIYLCSPLTKEPLKHFKHLLPKWISQCYKNSIILKQFNFNYLNWLPLNRWSTRRTWKSFNLLSQLSFFFFCRTNDYLAYLQMEITMFFVCDYLKSAVLSFSLHLNRLSRWVLAWLCGGEVSWLRNGIKLKICGFLDCCVSPKTCCFKAGKKGRQLSCYGANRRFAVVMRRYYANGSGKRRLFGSVQACMITIIPLIAGTECLSDSN